MGSGLLDGAPVHNMQRCLEELEQCILTIGQEPSISEREAVSDSDDEHYETAGLHLAVRPTVMQKVKHEQPVAQGGLPQGAPNVTEFMTYQSHTQVELIDLDKQF